MASEEENIESMQPFSLAGEEEEISSETSTIHNATLPKESKQRRSSKILLAAQKTKQTSLRNKIICLALSVISLFLIGFLSITFTTNGNGSSSSSSSEQGNEEESSSTVTSSGDGVVRTDSTSTDRFIVIGTIPSDKTAFTQGLTYGNNKLYMSTGLYGKSKVRQIDTNDGVIVENIDMEPQYFGEGLAFYDSNKLIQLTWKKQKGYIYETEPALKLIQEFSYSTTTTEGWGITHDPTRSEFIVSDGSHYLQFWNDSTLAESRSKLAIVEPSTQRPISNLNELEFINGYVFANVWFRDVILVIDPSDGTVMQTIDFSNLWRKSERAAQGSDVLNGISVFKDGELLLTGKLWPLIYRVKLLDFEV